MKQVFSKKNKYLCLLLDLLSERNSFFFRRISVRPINALRTSSLGVKTCYDYVKQHFFSYTTVRTIDYYNVLGIYVVTSRKICGEIFCHIVDKCFVGKNKP